MPQCSHELGLTVGAKNSAGAGTLLFLLTHIIIVWFIVHFTFQPALFLALVSGFGLFPNDS